MHFFKPNQSIIPFPNQLIDDSYEEKMVLVELMDRENSTSNLKKLLMEKPRMGYQIEASTNVHDSTILEDSLPPKEKDSRSFTIPCYINNICFKKALADFGASGSVMPYSTFTNLGLGELAPTKLIIELADRTIKRPKGMLDDIKVPLILKRPFLSTAHAKIDVFKRKITLRKSSRNLGPTIMEGVVIDEPMEDIVKTRNDDNEISNRIDEYPSFCDFD
ncbi:putative reverse transcriptase domain-containing protein [Tanacetum coccineum]